MGNFGSSVFYLLHIPPPTPFPVSCDISLLYNTYSVSIIYMAWQIRLATVVGSQVATADSHL